MARLDTTSLREAQRELVQGIRASEDWHKAYRDHPATFKALLRLESQLYLAVADYLLELSERAPAYVDWSRYMTLKADAGPVLNKGAGEWAAEELDLTRAVIDAITSLVAVGGQNAELVYGINIGITPLTDTIIEAARKQTATLVTGVTETTRNLIRQSVATSMQSGEDLDTAMRRLNMVLNNPKRAELIAQTESVTAYQRGQYVFATQTGAKKKTWESIAGACRICGPMDGVTVDIDDLFPNGALLPPGHPRCRCTAYYTY